MDGRVGIYLRDAGHELFLRAAFVQDVTPHRHARLLAALERTALVGQVIGTLPHPQDGERWFHAVLLERTHTFCDLLRQGVCHGQAQQFLGHGIPSL